MEERYRQAFSQVSEFVKDLWEVFGNEKVSPLALYNRLVDRINFTDRDPVNNCLNGFRQFMAIHHHNLIGNKMEAIPRSSRIVYGTSKVIYLEIGKFIHESDSEIKSVIRQHLLTIYATFESDENKIAEIEGQLDKSVKEEEFVSGVFNKAQTAMETIDTENPAAAMVGLFQSGIITDLMTGLQTGVQSGEMDMRKLMTVMQSTINNLIPAEGADLSIAKPTKVKDQIEEK